jgi:hypothetical protein
MARKMHFVGSAMEGLRNAINEHLPSVYPILPAPAFTVLSHKKSYVLEEVVGARDRDL